MGSIEFALAPVRSKILAPSSPQLYTTMNMCPMASAGKKKRAAAPKRKAAKKMTKHQKIVEKKRKSRAGMTIAQCVCHALRNAAKKEGMTMHQIRMCLNRSGVGSACEPKRSSKSTSSATAPPVPDSLPRSAAARSKERFTVDENGSRQKPTPRQERGSTRMEPVQQKDP